MTIPPVPADPSASTVAPSAWGADVDALLAFLRDSAPSIVGVSGGITVASGATVDIDMTTVGFDTEIGTWVKGTTTAARLDVPDPGRYLTNFCVVTSGMATPAGSAAMNLTPYVDAANARSARPPYSEVLFGTTTSTHPTSSVLFQFSAGGGIKFSLTQDSGVSQVLQVYFSVIWLAA